MAADGGPCDAGNTQSSASVTTGIVLEVCFRSSAILRAVHLPAFPSLAIFAAPNRRFFRAAFSVSIR